MLRVVLVLGKIPYLSRKISGNNNVLRFRKTRSLFENFMVVFERHYGRKSVAGWMKSDKANSALQSARRSRAASGGKNGRKRRKHSGRPFAAGLNKSSF
jgi:hypothetical protein